eukprot:scaffold4966_cov62-Phaeocystis_antarctica.AAC.2
MRCLNNGTEIASPRHIAQYTDLASQGARKGGFSMSIGSYPLVLSALWYLAVAREITNKLKKIVNSLYEYYTAPPATARTSLLTPHTRLTLAQVDLVRVRVRFSCRVPAGCQIRPQRAIPRPRDQDSDQSDCEGDAHRQLPSDVVIALRVPPDLLLRTCLDRGRGALPIHSHGVLLLVEGREIAITARTLGWSARTVQAVRQPLHDACRRRHEIPCKCGGGSA